jgi:hypothetical protein
MADLDADIWVCGECRSINNLKSKQCYRCRTPRDVAAVDPKQIEGTGHGRLREIALPEFRPTRWAALLASALLILVAVTQVVATVADAILFGRIVRDPAVLNDPAFYQSAESMVAGTVGIAALVVALIALIGWSFWLSRAVMAMPALGLGYPAANGLMAFVENFLPGLNLFRVPAIVRDVMRRLDPTALRGEVLIFAAWIGLLGGYLVPRLGAYLGLLGSGTVEEIVQQTLLVQAIATAMVVVGALFLVALIWWIERRIALRRAAQLAGELPIEASVAGAAPPAVAVPEGLSQAPAAPSDPRRSAGAGPPVPDPSAALGGAAPSAPMTAEGGAIAGPLGSIASRAEASSYVNRSITAATGAGSTLTEAPAAEPMPVESPSVEAPTGQVLADVPPAEPERPIDEAPAEDFGTKEAASTRREPRVDEAPSPTDDVLVTAETPVAGPDLAIETNAEAPPEPAVEAIAEEPAPEAAVETTAEAAPEPAVRTRRRSGAKGKAQVAASPEAAGEAEAQPSGEPAAAAGPQLHLRVESVSSMIATMDGESEPITLDELRVAAEALARVNGSAVIETIGTSFGALSLAEQAFDVLTSAQVVTTVEE